MKRFSIVEKGYNIDEVNSFIDVVIRRLAGKYMLYRKSFLLYNLSELWKPIEEGYLTKSG